MPLPEACVLRDVLDLRASETPHRCFASFADGQCWTFAQMRAHTRRAAAGLQKLGVQQDDKVLCWMPNGAEALRLWFAINYIGAVFVPLNPDYRGRLLEHVIENSGARLMLTHAPLIERLDGLQHGALREVVAIGGLALPVGDLILHASEVLDQHGDEPLPPARRLMPWDLQQIIYTSGTTGPSKGVLCSYLKAQAGEAAYDYLGPEDRYLINLPLFHVSGAAMVMNMLRRGGSVALVAPFSTATFWQVVRDAQATCCTLIGAMASLLVRMPAAAGDCDHRLRAVIILPLTEDSMAFSKRFGCPVYTVFSMTEVAAPIVSAKNEALAGQCGQARAGVELRIVDANDCEVAHGTAGELIVRSDIPWALSHGYHNAPEATAAAWRNGWFHTGDAFRRDVAGNYFFIDRIKDSIRRRGENISSFEVEAEVCAHPAVAEAAAYAVSDQMGGDEVMVAVRLKPDHTLAWTELLRFLIPRMARFMLPRYLREVAELPKTPTQKVQKALLRAEGVTPDSFDRIAAGFDLRDDAAMQELTPTEALQVEAPDGPEPMPPYRVEAFNLAAALENKMHDDRVASRYGFAGGLVPGTAIFGYMAHQPVTLWGRAWLERGMAECRFSQPVYDGKIALVNATRQADHLTLDVHSEGRLCASGSAAIPAHEPMPAIEQFRLAYPPPAHLRPPADQRSLAVGSVLCTAPSEATRDQALAWLAELRETDPIYAAAGLMHPAALLRLCNGVLMQNVVLGPWIHTASRLRNFNALPVGATLSARAVVLKNYQYKGHRMVDLDVLVVIDDKVPAARILHSAIYLPRPGRAPAESGIESNAVAVQ